MVWVRRVNFIAIVLIVVSGYYIINKTNSYLEEQKAAKYAHITAQIWVATALYNENPQKYRQFRDSLLKDEEITKEELNEYLNEYQDSPQKYLLFVSAVNVKVDSIINATDSTLLPREGLPADSALKID